MGGNEESLRMAGREKGKRVVGGGESGRRGKLWGGDLGIGLDFYVRRYELSFYYTKFIIV